MFTSLANQIAVSIGAREIQILYSTRRFCNVIAILSHSQLDEFLRISTKFTSRWHEPSRPPENLLEARLHESSWPPKLHERAHQLLVESRNLIVTDLVPLLSERSEDTRNRPNCSSENCLSRDWSEKSLKTSKLTCDSSLLLSQLCKKPQKLTWLVFSKTPICVPSTPRGSPLCQRTSNWHEESEESVLKFLMEKYQKAIFMATHLKHSYGLNHQLCPTKVVPFASEFDICDVSPIP